MTNFEVTARKQRNPEGARVCLSCGTPFQGELERDEYIPFYVECDECDEKTYFGTREEYERK